MIPLGLRRAFLPFAISRLLLVLVFTGIPLLQQGLADHWGAEDRMSLRLSPQAVADGLSSVAIRADATFYRGIAMDGYEKRPFDTSRAANWAYFPLHPLAWRAVGALTGEWVWSGLLLANVLTWLGLGMLWTLARRLVVSDRVADMAVLFACFWPTTYFMMVPHSESLFFLLATASLLAARSERLWWASILGGIASGARVNGAFLAPAIFIDRWFRGERRPADMAKLALIGAGLAAYMVYLWKITGNPFAFKDIQIKWGRELQPPWVALMDYVNRPLKIAMPWNPRLLNFSLTVMALCSVVACWRRGWRDLAVFTALTVLAPLSTGTLISMTRYIGVAPGVFIALAAWAEERPRFGTLWLSISVLAMTLLGILFTFGIDIGSA